MATELMASWVPNLVFFSFLPSISCVCCRPPGDHFSRWRLVRLKGCSLEGWRSPGSGCSSGYHSSCLCGMGRLSFPELPLPPLWNEHHVMLRVVAHLSSPMSLAAGLVLKLRHHPRHFAFVDFSWNIKDMSPNWCSKIDLRCPKSIHKTWDK